ncbi:hypothetical protein BC828DRAFT_394617 [Blastocladiella britannica]|nr:hypothetical protein BC828DRAFT_394617 [Blastocladiella britannica]
MSSDGVEKGRSQLFAELAKSAKYKRRGPPLLLDGGRACRRIKPEHKEYEAIYVPITLYSGTTVIPDRRSAHPIMIGLANLPAHLAAKPQHHLLMPIAYFPNVTKAKFRQFRIPVAFRSACQRGMFHSSLAVLFGEQWQAARTNGIPVELNCCKLLLFPDILYVSCDLPVAAMYTSTRGGRSMCPCPICELPLDMMASGDLSVHRAAPARVHVHGSMLADAQTRLGLWCETPNAFYKLVPNMHACISADDFHQFKSGS